MVIFLSLRALPLPIEICVRFRAFKLNFEASLLLRIQNFLVRTLEFCFCPLSALLRVVERYLQARELRGQDLPAQLLLAHLSPSFPYNGAPFWGTVYAGAVSGIFPPVLGGASS